MTKTEFLNKYFGYTSFRNGQEEIIDNILSGRDVLAVMPTGAGKSLCFQIPALMMSGTAIVISPLISLMKDQITALEENGINAVTINSSTSPNKLSHIYTTAYQGGYKLIYVSPERLDVPEFLKLAQSIDVSMVCVDEAHCVSQWGQDFRSSYLKISEFISSLKKRPVVTAFTATATKIVREDIIRLLELKNPQITVTGFDRENLYFEVQKPESKLLAVKRYLDAHPDYSGIIYCSTRKAVEELTLVLQQEGYGAARYHAGLNLNERKQNQEDFVHDRIKVMVATNAFGMGIDKSNVSFVIHYNMPGDIESYYQEAGRAGRDGEPAECILLFAKKDIMIHRYFIDNPSENEEMSEEEVHRMRRRRLTMLNHMTAYATGEICLRKYMLTYFGQRTGEDCGNCSVCCGERQYSDITVAAQKVLSAIARTKEKLPVYMIIDFLKGDESVGQYDPKLTKIKTFGIMNNLTKNQINEIIDDLLKENVIEMHDDNEAGILYLNENSKAVLFKNRRVRVKLKPTAGEKTKVKAKRADIQNTDYDVKLFSLLKNLRKTVADKKAVPAFVVFSDATLKDMSRIAPVTNDEFQTVSGVGDKKLKEYGPIFIKAIKLYKEKHIKSEN